MARKKEKARPLFSVKHEFADSLEAVCNEAIMLLQAVEMALRAGKIQDAVADALKERAAAFRATLITSDDE